MKKPAFAALNAIYMLLIASVALCMAVPGCIADSETIARVAGRSCAVTWYTAEDPTQEQVTEVKKVTDLLLRVFDSPGGNITSFYFAYHAQMAAEIKQSIADPKDRAVALTLADSILDGLDVLYDTKGWDRDKTVRPARAFVEAVNETLDMATTQKRLGVRKLE